MTSSANYQDVTILKELSNPPSVRAIRVLIKLLQNRRLKTKMINYFYHLILHKFCSILTCNILGIGLFIIGAIFVFKTIICASLRMKTNHKHTIPLRARVLLYFVSDI